MYRCGTRADTSFVFTRFNIQHAPVRITYHTFIRTSTKSCAGFVYVRITIIHSFSYFNEKLCQWYFLSLSNLSPAFTCVLLSYIHSNFNVKALLVVLFVSFKPWQAFRSFIFKFIHIPLQATSFTYTITIARRNN